MPYSSSRAAIGRAHRMCFLSTAISLALMTAACGGGGGDDATTTADDARKDTQDVSTSCLNVPPTAAPGVVISAAAFGARPDDTTDDTDALQRGLDALQSGQALLLPAGRYLISKSLHIRRPGTTLTGPGAILHGTNPDDQAVLVEADDVTVSSLTFTAVTDGRRSAPRHSRIAVAKGLIGGGYGNVYNTVIRDNRILGSGAIGSPTANSASGAAILMLRAQRFLIANNTIERSLADGIHMTMGSRIGRVLRNTVRETGDDMIAVVSYAQSGNPALNSAGTLRANWDALAADRLANNILIDGNNLSSPYWGRGIALVGAQSVTVSNNTLDNLPLMAGILLAREANYQTFGTGDVMVENNTIRNVQNMPPTYDYQGLFASRRPTGHAAIELNASVFADEAADPMLSGALSVHDVIARNNLVERGSSSGTRMGTPISGSVSAVDASGRSYTRTIQTGAILRQGVQSSRFNALKWEPINVQLPALNTTGIQCGANMRDGTAYQPGVCKTSAPAVRGAVLSCLADGRLN